MPHPIFVSLTPRPVRLMFGGVPITIETQGAVAAVWLGRLDEDNTMSSGRPEKADNTQREQRQRRMRRVQVAMAIFAACIGLFSFSSVAGNARFETYHTLDVIRLMTAGAGFGVALVLLIQFFKFSNPGSDDKKE